MDSGLEGWKELLPAGLVYCAISIPLFTWTRRAKNIIATWLLVASALIVALALITGGHLAEVVKALMSRPARGLLAQADTNIGKGWRMPIRTHDNVQGFRDPLSRRPFNIELSACERGRKPLEHDPLELHPLLIFEDTSIDRYAWAAVRYVASNPSVLHQEAPL